MAVRLHTNLGLVPEDERLEASPDAVLVQEPTIGATARSKGSLYAIASARGATVRAREGTRLLLETIQREYYYDKSAGIPICLQKAIRTANRRLAHRRDLHLPPGGLAAVVAVVRDRELYVATVGDADAFLARQGRLLTLPDAERGPGLPTPGDLEVDVWRGELLVGDVVLIGSRELAERLGTEELRQAITTLHPGPAARHLHNRLVAQGTQGSDAVMVIEASEVPATRVEHQLVPVRPAAPLAGAPDHSPIPLADSVVGGVTAVRGTARRASDAGATALVALLDRGLDLLPRRGPSPQRVRSVTDRRAAERRVATAVLGVLVLVLFVGVGYWLVSGGLRGKTAEIQKVNSGEDALATAREQIGQVFGGGSDLVKADPQQALTILRTAWRRARPGSAGRRRRRDRGVLPGAGFGGARPALLHGPDRGDDAGDDEQARSSCGPLRPCAWPRRLRRKIQPMPWLSFPCLAGWVCLVCWCWPMNKAAISGWNINSCYRLSPARPPSQWKMPDLYSGVAQEQQRMQAVLQNAADAILMFDANGCSELAQSCRRKTIQ